MKNYTLFLLFLPTFIFAQNGNLNTDLSQYLAKTAQNVHNPDMGGTEWLKISFSIQTLKGKTLFQHNADTFMPAASVIKIAILVELMEQVKVGKLKLEDTHTLLATDKIDEGIVSKYPTDTVLTFRNLAKNMIISSDNAATNIIIRKIGMPAVNQRLDKLGMKKTRLNRLMLDTEAVKQGRQNYVNTLEINNLLRLIYQNKVATKALCKEIMDFLLACNDRVTIPKWIPPSVKVAHKTGELTYVRGDAAIVFSSKPFILSVFVEGFKTVGEAERVIAEIGEICWKNLK